MISAFPRRSLSKIIIFAKHRAESAKPQSTAVLISFHTTPGRSEKSISPRLSARMTVTEDWEPELPPVSISIGMNAVSTTWAARAFSKLVMISPVKVADTIRRASHGILCLKRSQGLERR